MKFGVKRSADHGTIGKRIEADIRRTVATKLVASMTEMQRAVETTPVYTGRTIVNFRWSVGSPITDTRGPVLNPKLPGKTSEMTIGEEPRRAANTAVIQAEFAKVLAAVRANPFQNFFLRNNRPNYTDIEYGTYGADSRTPAGGITRRGEAMLKVIIRGVTQVE